MLTQHRMSTCKSRNRLTAGVVTFIATGATAVLVAPLSTAATTTVIGVDGIKQLVPGGNIMGALDVGQGVFRTFPDSDVVNVYTPQGFGILTDVMADGLAGGFNDPGYDQSKQIAKDNARAALIQAQAENPDGQVILVGFSQGADALSDLLADLEAEGYDTSNVTFVLAESPDNADGGIKTRLSWLPPIFVPFLGATVGGQKPTTSEHTRVIEVVQRWDGFADFPQYLNIVAVANALAGMVYLHSDTDKVNIDPSNPNMVITTTPNGLIEKRLITPELPPLLMAAEAFGMPHELALALKPLVVAIVETGYNRPDPTRPGTEPVEAVNATLLPPPSAWLGDLQSIATGLQDTMQNLQRLVNPGPANTLVQSVSPAPDTSVVPLMSTKVQPQAINQIPPTVSANLMRSAVVDNPAPVIDDDDAPAPLAAPQPPSGSQPEQQQDEPQPHAVQQSEDEGDDQQPEQQKGPETNVVRNSFNASTGSPSTGSGSQTGVHNPDPVGQVVNNTIKSFTDGVNNVVKSVEGALSPKPKPANSSTPSGPAGSSDGPSAGASTGNDS